MEQTPRLASANAEDKNGNLDLYLMALLFGISTFGAYGLLKNRFSSITIWAARNPMAARASIAGLHMGVIGSGVALGYGLNEINYSLTDAWYQMFGGLAILTVGMSPSAKRLSGRNGSGLRNGFGLGLLLFGFFLSVFFGNRVLSAAPEKLIEESKDMIMPFGDSTVKLVALSPVVGDTISRAEKIKYRLFPSIDNLKFEYACFYQRPSGGGFLKATMNDGSVKFINYSERDLEKLRYYLQHPESPLPSEGKTPSREHVTGAMIFGVIFFALLLILAMVGVAMLACTLACNGYGVAAILVLLGGYALAIFLYALSVKAVMGSENKRSANNAIYLTLGILFFLAFLPYLLAI